MGGRKLCFCFPLCSLCSLWLNRKLTTADTEEHGERKCREDGKAGRKSALHLCVRCVLCAATYLPDESPDDAFQILNTFRRGLVDIAHDESLR